jgi:hypothetical protein
VRLFTKTLLFLENNLKSSKWLVHLEFKNQCEGQKNDDERDDIIIDKLITRIVFSFQFDIFFFCYLEALMTYDNLLSKTLNMFIIFNDQIP